MLRLEFGLGLVGCLALMIAHVDDIRWWVVVVLFLYPDLMGYLPGALAYRRSPDKRISRVHYVLYNIGHSFITGAVIAGLWALVVGPEWALLVIPAHLCGDRSLFGNFPKSFAVAFEPEPHPAWERVSGQLLPRPSAKAPAAVADEALVGGAQ
jgi:hypothetical protein